MAGRRTIVGSKALLLAATGEKEIAAQIFDYSMIREIRADLNDLEVKILTTYDDAFYRVFKVRLENPNDKAKVDEARKVLIKFYNDLLNASMRFTKEEMELLVENAKNQRQLQQQGTNENISVPTTNEETKEVVKEVKPKAKPKTKKE